MSVKRKAALLCCSLCLAFSHTASSQLILEHDVGLGFSEAGRLLEETAIRSDQGGLRLGYERREFSEEEKRSFKQQLQNDGYYKLRLVQPGGSVLVTSVPARCLGLGRKLQIDKATSQGEFLGMSYLLTSPPCNRDVFPKDAEAWVGKQEGHAEIFAPIRAPDIDLPVLPSGPPGSKPAAARPQGAGAPGARPPRVKSLEGLDSEGEETEEESEPVVPEVEKTWMQKNWMFIMAFTFIAIQIMGKIATPAEEPPPARGAANPAGAPQQALPAGNSSPARRPPSGGPQRRRN